MRDDSLNKAEMALNNAGFEVLGYSQKKPYGALKLKVISVIEHCHCRKATTIYDPPTAENLNRNPGETFDLVRYLYAENWRHAICLVQEAVRSGKTSMFNIGDFIFASFEVPVAEHKGLRFEKLIVNNAKIQIVDITTEGIIFNFEEILFESAINAKNTNDGGFSESALSAYLNNEFLKALFVSADNSGEKITLLCAYELFGNEEYRAASSNFYKEPKQFEYFKNEKNRVKAFKDETHCYWTSSPSASSFVRVNYRGSDYYTGVFAVGGVAPAFCVA